MAEDDKITGEDLAARLQGVKPMAVLAGRPGFGVIESVVAENGLQAPEAVRSGPAPEQPKTAMNFLAPGKVQ